MTGTADVVDAHLVVCALRLEEDILTTDHIEELAAIRHQLAPVLLAGGEHDFTPRNFELIGRAGALDIWQPDITWCGGITAGLRILDLARNYDIPVCPHRGGEIWGLHLIASTECMDLAETHPDRWNNPDELVWMNEPAVTCGAISPPTLPGFGVKLNPVLG